MVEGVGVDAEGLVHDALRGAINTISIRDLFKLGHCFSKTSIFFKANYNVMHLFPPPYRRGSTHMSNSGVESMISWNSDHSSLLPIPKKKKKNTQVASPGTRHITCGAVLSTQSPHRCWRCGCPGSPAPPCSCSAVWHFSGGPPNASRPALAGGSPRWWAWRWPRARRTWACWTCSPCCWAWPPPSPTLSRPPSGGEEVC